MKTYLVDVWTSGVYVSSDVVDMTREAYARVGFQVGDCKIVEDSPMVYKLELELEHFNALPSACFIGESASWDAADCVICGVKQ